MSEDEVNKRNGVASLLQLTATSTMENDYMYSGEHDELNPLFYTTHTHATRFDREPYTEEYRTYTGSKVIHTFDTMLSDMIGNIILKIDIPSIDDELLWTNDVAHALIKSIRVVNGDEELAQFSGEYLHISSKLDVPESKKRGVDEMISHYNSKFSLSNKSRVLYVDIPFLKTGEECQFFPIMNTKNNAFSVVIQLESITNLALAKTIAQEEYVYFNIYVSGENVRTTMSTTNTHVIENLNEVPIVVGIIYDSVHLSNEERSLFLSRKSNILFKSVQSREVYMPPQTFEDKIILDFTNNISELIVVLTLNQQESNMKGFNPFVFRPLSGLSLYLNGVEMNNNILSNRYDNKHKRIPNTPIYVISFCMDNMTNQPTGTHSFAGSTTSLRNDFASGDHNHLFFGNKQERKASSGNPYNNEIRIVRDKAYMNEACTIKVFAKYYNVMRIEDKSVSLQYL